MSTPAAWHPDPTGRHEYRYWDGQQWTEHVANGGVAAVDPLPGTPAAAQQQAAEEAAGVTQQPTDSTTASATTPVAEAGPTEQHELATASESAGAGSDDAATVTTNADAATGSSDQATDVPNETTGSEPLADVDEHTTETGSEQADTAASAGDESHIRLVTDTSSAEHTETPTSSSASPGPESRPDTTADTGTAETQTPPTAAGAATATGAAGADAAAATSGPLQDISRQPAYAAQSTEAANPIAGGTQEGTSGSNVAAIIALVVGILSLLIAVIPFIGLLGVLGGIIAVVLGIVGRKKAKQLLGGKAASTAGIITGALAIVLGIGSTLFVVLFLVPTADFTAMAECVRQTGDPQACADLFESSLMQRFGMP